MIIIVRISILSLRNESGLSLIKVDTHCKAAILKLRPTAPDVCRVLGVMHLISNLSSSSFNLYLYLPLLNAKTILCICICILVQSFYMICQSTYWYLFGQPLYLCLLVQVMCLCLYLLGQSLCLYLYLLEQSLY